MEITFFKFFSKNFFKFSKKFKLNKQCFIKKKKNPLIQLKLFFKKSKIKIN
jgi:hypothetical protein